MLIPSSTLKQGTTIEWLKYVYGGFKFRGNLIALVITIETYKFVLEASVIPLLKIHFLPMDYSI